jgi:hypothetical protein
LDYGDAVRYAVDNFKEHGSENTTNTSCATKRGKPKAAVLRRVRSELSDLEAFIKSPEGIACGSARRMKEATDWLLLFGTVEKARRKMDQLLKKARIAGLPITAA